MWACLFLIAVCSASDKLAVNFRLHSFTNLNSSELKLQVEGLNHGVNGNEQVLVGRHVGNNTFQGKIFLPWRRNEATPQLIQLTIMSENFLQKGIQMFVKPEGITRMKMSTEDYRIHLSTEVKSYFEVQSPLNKYLKGCACVKGACACCETVRVSELKFDHTICANMTYKPDDIGIEVALGVDGHYYKEEISARNPPPICFDVPWAKEIAALCLAFKKLDITREHLAGCLEVELELAHFRIFHIQLGCFNMPI